MYCSIYIYIHIYDHIHIYDLLIFIFNYLILTCIYLNTCRNTDRVIQKKRREYSDPNSSSNAKKLNDDLQSIHNIMRKTIDDVLDRGQKLEGRLYMYIVYVYWAFIYVLIHHSYLILFVYIHVDVGEMSKSLANESKNYKWGAKKLSTMVSIDCISIVSILLVIILYFDY